MMNKKSLSGIVSKLPSIIVLTLAFGSMAFAASWTGPTAPAPGNNVDAPVNVGAVAQTKTGNFTVNGVLNAAGGMIGTNVVVDSVTVGPIAKIGAITSPEFCIGTDCITTWPGGDAAGDSSVVPAYFPGNGYVESPVNSTEDSLGAVGSPSSADVADTCDGNKHGSSACSPGYQGTCVDVLSPASGCHGTLRGGIACSTHAVSVTRTCAVATALVKLPNIETKRVNFMPDYNTAASPGTEYTAATSQAYAKFWLSDAGAIPRASAGYPVYTEFSADGAWHRVWSYSCDGGSWIDIKYSGTTFTLRARADEDCIYSYRHNTQYIKASFRN